MLEESLICSSKFYLVCFQIFLMIPFPFFFKSREYLDWKRAMKIQSFSIFSVFYRLLGSYHAPKVTQIDHSKRKETKKWILLKFHQTFCRIKNLDVTLKYLKIHLFFLIHVLKYKDIVVNIPLCAHSISTWITQMIEFCLL